MRHMPRARFPGSMSRLSWPRVLRKSGFTALQGLILNDSPLNLWCAPPTYLCQSVDILCNSAARPLRIGGEFLSLTQPSRRLRTSVAYQLRIQWASVANPRQLHYHCFPVSWIHCRSMEVDRDAVVANDASLTVRPQQELPEVTTTFSLIVAHMKRNAWYAAISRSKCAEPIELPVVENIVSLTLCPQQQLRVVGSHISLTVGP